MSIKLKFGLIFLATFFVISVLGFRLISLNDEMNRRMYQTSFSYRQIETLISLKSEIQSAIKEIYDIVILREGREELDLHEEASLEYLRQLESLEKDGIYNNSENVDEKRKNFQKLRNKVKKIFSEGNKLVFLDRKDQKQLFEGFEEILEKKFENEFSVFLTDIIKAEKLKLVRYSKDEKVATERIEFFTFILLGILFAAFSFIFIFVAKKLVKPILDLEKAAEKIAQNDFDVEISHQSSDEVGKLSSAFLNMSQRIEKNVGELKTLLASIVESSDDAIIGKGLDDRIISWNKGAERLLGYSHDEAVGSHINLIMPEEKRNDLLRVNSQINSGQPVGHFETQRLAKNNELIEVSLNVSPIKNHNGEVIGGSAIVRDIRALKQTQKELIEAKEIAEKASFAKSEFLSRMSHELRTPMNAILGFGQLLRLEIKNKNQKIELTEVDYILNAGKHLLELINEVLDLSRIETGALKVTLESVDLAKIIEETIGLIKPIADENSITIINNCHNQKNIYVMADGIRLKQIILNLLSNAIKYNRVNGTVTISYEIKDEKLKLKISDTGIGISEENYEDLFKPFERLGAEKGEVQGVGIGLSICKKLVELLNGLIYFESEFGKGSTFIIELGLGKPVLNDVKGSELDDMNVRHATENKTILYIEDDPVNLKLVQYILRKYKSFDLIAAPNAQLGIEIAKAQKPHLVLLDIHLPGMDGFTAFNKLKAMKETESIPVIAVTSDAMEADKEKALKMGFFHHLSKPLDIQEFIKTIDQALAIKS
jgi:PAS domain S-box-containing protein